MPTRANLEAEIRNLIQTATQAVSLSNALFSPEGLFNQLATTTDERRALAQSVLFREAQRRLSELQEREGADFSQAVEQAQGSLPAGAYLLKWERAESPS